MRGSAFQFVRPAFLLLMAAIAPRSAYAVDAAGVEFYEKQVRPLFAEHCYACHGPDKQRAGLRLDQVADIIRGGDRGPAIGVDSPEESWLIRAVRYTDDKVRMPPKGKLSEAQIADLVAWVKMGAPGPRGSPDVRTNLPV